MIRVLVAEDSAVTRQYLDHLLSQDPALQVVGTVENGREALEHAERLKPDVILMDVHMPLMNGYEATRRIMECVPTPIVMVSSSISRDQIAMTFEALDAGALTVLNKPHGLGHPKSEISASQLKETVRLMAGVKVIRRWPKRNRPTATASSIPRLAKETQLIAIGASTGGPTVIAGILSGLPKTFPAPILAVQHIAPGFTSGLVDWIGRSTLLRVKLAQDGESVHPGTVYLAPHGTQMGVSKSRKILLVDGPTENSFCPSVSHLFQSVAEVVGRFGAGILLTGMGQDGAAGLLRLRKVGGTTIVQDEETCIVFGMPGEAVRLGAAQYVLSPKEIAEALGNLV
jgi:two-component system chemotaxis response regulator CheB